MLIMCVSYDTSSTPTSPRQSMTDRLLKRIADSRPNCRVLPDTIFEKQLYAEAQIIHNGIKYLCTIESGIGWKYKEVIIR